MTENKKVPPRRLSIDPVYVPADKLWYAEEFDKSAPSLRELLEKLPKGTQIRNYYQGNAPTKKFENMGTMTRSAPLGSLCPISRYVIS
jgi:hypothetical protein